MGNKAVSTRVAKRKGRVGAASRSTSDALNDTVGATAKDEHLTAVLQVNFVAFS